MYARRTAVTIEDGFALAGEVGWEFITGRAQAATKDLAADAILAGISMGASVVETLLPTRPQAAGVLLWHGLARATALTAAQQRSPLARVPYHLRHAAVSLWLNAGVPATQVAEWAGHSVHVLLKVYAKCVDGQDEVARRRIEAALQQPDGS